MNLSCATSWIVLFLLSAAVSADEIVLSTGERVRGDIVSCSPTGEVRIRISESRERVLLIDEVRFLNFREGEAPETPLPFLLLRDGSRLAVREVRYREGRMSFESVLGRREVGKEVVRTYFVQAPDAPAAEAGETPEDILVLQAGERAVPKPVEKPAEEEGDEEEQEPGEEPFAEIRIGRLVEIDGEGFVFHETGEEEAERVPGSRIQSFFPAPPTESRESPVGWFAHVQLRSGDWIPGAMRGLDGKEVEIFSATFGRCRFSRDAVHSIAFLTTLEGTFHSILLGDAKSIREIDASGKERWSMAVSVPPISLRSAGDYSVLATFLEEGRVVEFEVSTGGTLWEMGGLSRPTDGVRTRDGGYAVLEQGKHRLAVFSGGKKLQREIKVGGTPSWFVPLAGDVVLVGGWEASPLLEVSVGDGSARPSEYKLAPESDAVERLANGNLLLVSQGSCVLEMDSAGRVVWRSEGWESPVTAHRLPDGNTLILESDTDRLWELDPPGRRVREIRVGEGASAMEVRP